MISLTHEWIQTIVLLGGAISSCFYAVYEIGRRNEGMVSKFEKSLDKIRADLSASSKDNKAEFNAMLDLKEAEFDGKIGKVWERFDSYKTLCNNTFVSQQTCNLIHNGTEKALIEIARRMENLEKKTDAVLISLTDKKI
jgi:hypothetical protein